MTPGLAFALANRADDLEAIELGHVQVEEQQVVLALLEELERAASVVGVVGAIAALPQDRDRCAAAGIDDYLAKPVGPAALTSIIERVLAAEPELERWLDPVAILHASQDDEAMYASLARDSTTRAMQLLADVRAALAAEDRRRIADTALQLGACTRSFSAVAAQRAGELERAADVTPFDQLRSTVAQLAAVVELVVLRVPSLTLAQLRRQVRRSRA